MAALAAQFVNSTDRHVFLTGKAGTGKTTFLRRLAERTHKRFVILAPTGIAALNAGGVTIHSQFLLPFGAFVPERQLPADVPEYAAFHDRDTLNRRHPLNAVRRNVLRDVDLLIIDEVSMLRADLLDAIDHRMRSVRQRWDRSFGGAQVLMIGDLFQLPPVVKDDEWAVLRRWYPSLHFFNARVLRESGYAHIELDRIFRQQDERFIRILNNLRDNKVTADDVLELNTHFRPSLSAADTDGVITLTTHNRTADELNQQELDKLPGKPWRFEAEVEGDFPESMYPVLSTLELKPGAQVMFTRNDPEKAYFNGKLARVQRITKDDVEVRMVDTGMPYTLKKATWENKRYVVDPVSKEQQEQMLGTFTQYPVKLAWAITVHKSQGLTFDKAIIDVGKAFAPGQVYVALSRLRSLDGLVLRTRIDPSVVTTDRDVVAFSEARHAQQPLPEQLKEQQQHYLRAVLTSTFDLGDLQRKVDWIRKDHPETAEFEDDSMKTALVRFRELLGREEENTRKFQGQLVRLLQGDERGALLERVGKGSGYYTDLLTAAMKDLLQHLAQVEALSRTKQYSEDLRELDGMLVKKLAQLGKAVHIATCILEGREVEKVPELEKRITAQRTALVDEVKAWAQAHAPATSRKTGRTKRKATDAWEVPDAPVKKRSKKSAFAKASADKEKAPPKIKGETYLKTYVLIKEGRSLADVAKERGMSVSTIEGHAARGIAEDVLDIDALMPAEERDTIAGWMQEHPDKGLNDARANFGDRFSFGQLRMVQAWVKKEA
ncbi:MAG: AAA family ATPase [Flavobacteriales bacterium]|nr:AAA family ATPase [Flavobacteriales bacterium]